MSWQQTGYAYHDGEKWVHEFFDCTYGLILTEADLADEPAKSKIPPEEESMVNPKTEE